MQMEAKNNDPSKVEFHNSTRSIQKIFSPVTLSLVLVAWCCVHHTVSGQDNPKYDDSLAQTLQADPWGMRTYYFVLLTTGSANITDEKKRNECFESHMNNINTLVKEKKLIVAGPFGKNNESLRGIFIFSANSAEEVQEWLKGDEAIQQNILKATITEWYGSAALPTYLEYHEKVWQQEF